MDTHLTVRPASRADLPQLLALYRHLNAADRTPVLELAERRFEQLKKYPGSEILVGLSEAALVTSCTLVVIPNLTRGGQPYGLRRQVLPKCTSIGVRHNYIRKHQLAHNAIKEVDDRMRIA